MPDKTILVVEDDSDLSDLVVKKLTEEKFKAVPVATGQEVLDYLDNNRPDLILLDILLPDIDGITVLQEIASKDETNAIPVIIFSNLSEEGSFEQVAAVGEYEYLIKAKINLNDVVKRIKVRLGIK